MQAGPIYSQIVQIYITLYWQVTETRCVQAFKLRNKDLHSFKRQSLSLFGITNTYKIQQTMELIKMHLQEI